MTKEKFLQEIESWKNEVIFEKIKNHSLPVVVFGAGAYAGHVTKILNEQGIKIFGYAVDEDYYMPNKIYLNRPIYNFEKLVEEKNKYVFVNGLGVLIHPGFMNTDKIKKMVNRKLKFLNDNRITKYDFIWEKCFSVDIKYMLENKNKFWETYSWLSDEISKKMFLAYLKSHVTEDLSYMATALKSAGEYHKDPVTAKLEKAVFTREYFNNTISQAFERYSSGGYIDCGAYTGDTINGFINWNGGRYTKIFAFEPDSQNFSVLEKFVKQNGYENISLFNCGAWNEKTILTFQENGDAASKLSEDGNISLAVDFIDNVVDDTPINLIKMDIEGAELNALKGAVKTLKRWRPILTICVYHKPEDLITIPQFIKEIYGNCHFYLRKHWGLNLWEFVLYVIPD